MIHKALLLVVLSFFSISAFPGEPYAFRVSSTFQREATLELHHGLCFPVKVSGKKRLLTALHVVNRGRNADEILVDFPQGLIRCKIVKDLPDLDLCLLEPMIEPPFTLSVAEKNPKVGDEVTNPNYFSEMRMTIRNGKVGEEFKGRDFKGAMTGLIEAFSQGSSGGPVIGKDGKVVGIGIAGTTTDGTTIVKAIFIPAESIRAFLKKD